MYIKLKTTSVYHEGDERSRTNPGHGYPAYTEEVPTHTIFKTKQELEAWILRNPEDSSNIFHMTPVKVVKHVTLSLG